MVANKPVSDDTFDRFPGRSSQHFDRVRNLLAQEPGDFDA